jgi:formate hydrogenlyase subunit 3/multisubunit Na+/H+ antiporter MnhD subunit
VIVLPLALRSKEAPARCTFLNTFTILHGACYLGISIYVLAAVDLPVFFFKQYLFIDSLAIYEVLITTKIFLLAAIYGHGYYQIPAANQRAKSPILKPLLHLL